ncbi:Uncharacterized protein SCF082_LOCUS1828 [Durusdinium trenchii]|uniref:Uncharacterized protein n=1 Tax=Durusdinium trenchii TaxID=1381693 RepID=A0ABP0HJH3_9DINO
MQSIYEKLENLQGECAVTRSAKPETQKQILSLCAECTKTDAQSAERVARLAAVAHQKLQKHGVVDRSLQRLASCGSAAKNATYTGHACEKLHRVIAKEKRKLDVKISRVPLWVRYSRKRLAPAFVHYPVLRMPDWVETIFKNGGHFFLGGRSMDMWPQVQNELLHFWSAYKKIDSDFPLYKDMPESKLGSCIPVAIHGDEGRGRLHNPVMVVALQTLLPLVGKKTNMQGSSLCTRLLYTCLPAPYSHKSFHTLLSVLAEDLNKMWKDGVDDWWDVKKMKSMPVTATNPNAFKGGPPSPLRSLPLGDCCRYVRIDGAHTYAIDGIGKDFLASSLLMLVRMGHFGSGPTERCLQNAYANFLAYCNSHSKNTTIEDFSHGSLKLNGWPRGLGKGHDASEEEYKDMLEVLTIACLAIDRFWRTIYNHGVWIPRGTAEGLVSEGFIFTDLGL